jgi:hypothetical protein
MGLEKEGGAERGEIERKREKEFRAKIPLGLDRCY